MNICPNEGKMRESREFLMAANIKRTFATNLKALMKSSDLSSAQVARDINVSPATITLWLQGKNWPGDTYLDRLMDTYKWTEAQLFAGRDTPISELLKEHNRSGSPFVIGLK